MEAEGSPGVEGWESREQPSRESSPAIGSGGQDRTASRRTEGGSTASTGPEQGGKEE